MSRGAVCGWTSPVVLALFATSVVVVVLWVVVESRAEHPLIDMRMMRLRAVWTTNLTTLLVGVAMFAAFAFLPQFLQTPPSAGYGFGASIAETGLLVLPQAVGAFAVGLVAGRLGQRYGSKNVLLVSIAVAAGALCALSFVHDERWQIYLLTSFFGMGVGGAFAASPNFIVAAVPPEQTGVASGMHANLRTIGGSVGAAAMATVVTSHVGLQDCRSSRDTAAGSSCSPGRSCSGPQRRCSSRACAATRSPVKSRTCPLGTPRRLSSWVGPSSRAAQRVISLDVGDGQRERIREPRDARRSGVLTSG